MVVRICFGRGPRLQRGTGKNRRLALGFGALLTPAAVMAFVLGFWRLAADIGLTAAFGISTGFFSHWQIWVTAAGLLQWSAWALTRYGQGKDHSSATATRN